MGRSHNKHNSQSLRLEIQDQGTGSVGGWELMYWVVDATSHDLTWHKGESSVGLFSQGHRPHHEGPTLVPPPQVSLYEFGAGDTHSAHGSQP